MTEQSRMRRCYSVNEVLIRLMSARIKTQCNRMVADGMTVEQVNEALPAIVSQWDEWREQTLQRLMTDIDDPEQAWPIDPLTLKPMMPN